MGKTPERGKNNPIAALSPGKGWDKRTPRPYPSTLKPGSGLKNDSRAIFNI